MDASTLIQRISGKPHNILEYRSPYMRDECRVVHSFSFRRLQGKTQVLGPEQGDFHRNRLTHSIEVASIGRGIVKYLNEYLKKLKDNKMKQDCLALLHPSKTEYCGNNEYDYLISAVCLLHDVGHPPFGHAGEEALNFKMRNHHGFEGNAQTLRIVTQLEPYTEHFGLDLTRRVLLGLIKYPVPYSKLVTNNNITAQNFRNRDIKLKNFRPPKCYYDDDLKILNWLTNFLTPNDKELLSHIHVRDGHKESIYKTFDCSIMELADDIAYSIHDLEDAIFLGLIKIKDLKECPQLEFLKNDTKDKLFDDFTDEKDLFKRKKAFKRLIRALIEEIKITENVGFDNILLKYKVEFSTDAQNVIEAIKKLIESKTYGSQEIQTILLGGMMTIMQLFDVLIANPNELLPTEYNKRITKSDDNDYRVVCDYISGMTDEYSRRLHDRIYGNYPGSVFEKL